MYKKAVSLGFVALLLFGTILAVGMIGFFWYRGTYNTLVRLDVNCDVGWAEIENQYQRRYDLIPRIVNATKLYINYETKLLTDISEARSQWGKALASGDQSEVEEAATGIERVVGRLLMVTISENYPELKADKHTMALIDELTGTENRIAVARMRYNENVGTYNTFRRGFIVQMFFSNQFAEKHYFEIQDDAWEAPNVNIG